MTHDHFFRWIVGLTVMLVAVVWWLLWLWR